MEARDRLITATLRYIEAERAMAGMPAELEYSGELLALAARELYVATEKLPRGERPVGWNGKPHEDDVAPVNLTADELETLVAALAFYGKGKYADLKERLLQERVAFDRDA